VPAIGKFCALKPRFTVTDAPCAIKAVIGNTNKQRAIREMDFLGGPTGKSVEFKFSIIAFIRRHPFL
jgi:hypothetical protein